MVEFPGDDTHLHICVFILNVLIEPLDHAVHVSILRDERSLVTLSILQSSMDTLRAAPTTSPETAESGSGAVS